MDRGIVLAVIGNQVVVSVPRRGAGFQFGPLDVVGALPVVGQRVIVGVIGPAADDLVVLGILR